MVLSEILLATLAGLAATIPMTLFEFPFWKKWGLTGVTDWQVNAVIVSKLARKSTGDQESLISLTIGSHLFHGSMASIAFILLLPPIIVVLPAAKFSILLTALVYSIILWVIFSVILRRTFESAGRIRISNRGVLVTLLSHCVYGIFLGLFTLASQSTFAV